MPSSGDGTQATDEPYSIRSVHRVCDILDLLKTSPSASLPEIAETAQLPKTSAFRYLATLESRSYVQRDPVRGAYQLGSAFLDVPAQQLELMAKRLRPHLEALCAKTHETIVLGVLDGRRTLVLDIVEPERGVRVAPRKGDHEHIHCTAIGKVVCAQLTDAQVTAILKAAGMPAHTPATITDPQTFVEELARVRQLGYGIDDCEDEIDGRCVAVAVPGAPVLTGVGISAPANRLPPEDMERVAAQLAKAAKGMMATLASDAALVAAS